jgi:hypothetical protein
MEFSSDQSSQPVRRTSQVPNGPPGLVQRQTNQQSDATSADLSRVTSPSGQTQLCKSRIKTLVDVLIKALSGITDSTKPERYNRTRQISRSACEVPDQRLFTRLAVASTGPSVSGNVCRQGFWRSTCTINGVDIRRYDRKRKIWNERIHCGTRQQQSRGTESNARGRPIDARNQHGLSRTAASLISRPMGRTQCSAIATTRLGVQHTGLLYGQKDCTSGQSDQRIHG